jgi:hypothetical protein
MNTGVATASRAVSSVASRAREPATVAWTVNLTPSFLTGMPSVEVMR